MNYDPTQVAFSQWLGWPIEQTWPLDGGVMFNGQQDDISDLYHRILQSRLVNNFIVSDSNNAITLRFVHDTATTVEIIKQALIGQ